MGNKRRIEIGNTLYLLEEVHWVQKRVCTNNKRVKRDNKKWYQSKYITVEETSYYLLISTGTGKILSRGEYVDSDQYGSSKIPARTYPDITNSRIDFNSIKERDKEYSRIKKELEKYEKIK